ncbi:MAG: hypothetical protein U9R34_02305 [Nanoarchaeota archaeon]|nr:hypothetical protein [Nanoarchaeota archaeon]
MKKYIPNTIKVLSFIPLFYAAGGIDYQGSEKPAESKMHTSPVLQIDNVPHGVEGTLDSYLREENVIDRVSYNKASKVLCQLNPHSGSIMGDCNNLGDYDSGF